MQDSQLNLLLNSKKTNNFDTDSFDNSFNSRASQPLENKKLSSDNIVQLSQPITFYEVNEEIEENQYIENKVWTQSFDGQLFSIAE